MTIIWLVTVKRFLQEYHNHIKDLPSKYVNWMVESNGYIRFYIEQTNGPNTYCYVHTGGADTIPLEIKMIWDEKGAIVGIEGIDYEEGDEVESKLDDLASRIKFNMVKKND